MPLKKRFFTHKKKKSGNNSGIIRENKAQNKDVPTRALNLQKEPDHGRNDLPNIYRFITDVKSRIQKNVKEVLKNDREAVGIFGKKLLSLHIFLAVLLGICFFSIFLFESILLIQVGQKVVGIFLQRQEMVEEMGLWESIGRRFPTYRDAYFQAAVLAYRLGDKQKEVLFLQKVFIIDPNYEPAKQLQSLQ